jgi:subtilisin family serine protease
MSTPGWSDAKLVGGVQLTDVWRELRRKEIEEDSERLSPIAWGGLDNRSFFYRPHELLLGDEAWANLRSSLEERFDARPYEPGILPDEEDWRQRPGTPGAGRNINERLRQAEIPLQVIVLDPNKDRDVHLPELVVELRGKVGNEDDPAYGVHLNHVLFAEPIYHGGPDGIAEPTEAPSLPSTGPLSTAVDIAVLDTGIPADYAQIHPELTALSPDADDHDPLDENGDDRLDTCGGHGLFICGIVHRLAPGLRVDPGRVLRAIGEGDDTQIAAEVVETRAAVINLSLGGSTMDGNPLPALRPAIERAVDLHGKAVVAAAGNLGRHDPDGEWWPGAMPQVIGVGAYDSTTDPNLAIAEFSNRGPWVDVYAPGVAIRSAYAKGWANPLGTTFEGWARWDGTSFAAPHVAAWIALQLPAHPGRTARDVARYLIGRLTAETVPVEGTGTTISAKLYRPPVNLTT